MRKVLVWVLLFVVSSLFVNAAVCNSDAIVRIHFIAVTNSGTGGNLDKKIFVGTSATQFLDNEAIPLSSNGVFITDTGYVENVPGISLQRVDGGLRFLLFGGSYWSKETLSAVISVEGAKISSFSNDFGRAATSPKSLNSLENQGNGVYIVGNTKDDEVFYTVGGTIATWYSTVARDNDGFYLYVKCDDAPVIKCKSNADCGVDGYVSSPVCSGSDVTRVYQTFTCSNPNTTSSMCSASNSTMVVETCAYGCSGGACTLPNISCTLNSDCGVDGYVGTPVCSGKDVVRNYQAFTCSIPGTSQSMCSSLTSSKVVETCSYGCSNGLCTMPYCGNGIADPGEECDDGNTINGDGCSSTCKVENDGNYTYVISYVGDIDGAVDENWFYFYAQLTDFYNTNKIPASFSLYPATMLKNAALESSYRNMYEGGNIELIQKGNNGDDNEMNMDNLTYDQQKAIVKTGQDTFRLRMAEITGKSQSEINVPVTYDQIGARFTDVLRGILIELNFKTYFDVYTGDGLGPVNPTTDFDVIQYGVSFTTDGGAGPEKDFKTKEQVISDIKSFDRTDVPITRINGHVVVPIWVHQQDFEGRTVSTDYDINKWDIYTTTLLALKNDPEIRLVTVNDVYRMGHNGTVEPPKPPLDNQTICQYANSASANSEGSSSLAKYATGRPDGPSSGECASWSGAGYGWTPLNWDVKGVLTLAYETPVYVSNITVFGDYDICWSAISLKNSKTGMERIVLNTEDETCVFKKSFTEDFQADTVVLTTCGWSWSATDAVQMCGSTDSNITPPEPPVGPSNVTICPWKGCKKGAVSVSVDDEYDSCIPELEAYGLRGTYFLTNTDRYTADKWNTFNQAFLKGHELGTHMQQHWCMSISESNFYSNIENNIVDITTRTSATRDDIVSHAYPCGYTFGIGKNLLKSNWNFLSARGYNFNQLEEQTPNDFFELKSYNSHGYPGGSLEPPSYFAAVDQAEINGKWLNLVYHNECSDDGVISYLPSKNVWVDTIGNVARYIRLRDAAVVSNYGEIGSEIRFSIKVADGMDKAYYRQDLTLQVPLGSTKVSSVKFNARDISYTLYENSKGNYVMFNVPFPINGDVIITRA
jgi:cysteine-rich repeat protein